MPSKCLLDRFAECAEDMKIIYEFYCENGEEAGIIEMIPPVKYLLASIADILNDGILNNQTGFYTHYKQISMINGKLNANWDEFDKGLIWIIQRLNTNTLSFVLNSNYEKITTFYERNSSIMISKREEFIRIIRNMEKDVKFKLYQEDLYTTRIRFNVKSQSRLQEHPHVEEEEESQIQEHSHVEEHQSEFEDDLSASPIQSDSKKNDVMISSFISMEAIDIKLLQERELMKTEMSLLNKLKYNSMRFINNFRIGKKLKPLKSNFNVVEDEEFESLNIFSSEKDKQVEEFESILRMEICPEKGLISQNYSCTICGNGISSKDSIKCDFSGEYSCPKCHGGGESINPIRILRNWDFTKYPISNQNRRIINDFSYNFLINFPKINPKEFKSNEKFKLVQKLREKIYKSAEKRLKAAGKLEGPRQLAILEKLAWPKTHLLTSVDLYTIEDLIEIEMGTFCGSVLLPLYNLLKL